MGTPKDNPLAALDPAERAEARKAQRAMLRAALGAQYAAWLKTKIKKRQENK